MSSAPSLAALAAVTAFTAQAPERRGGEGAAAPLLPLPLPPGPGPPRGSAAGTPRPPAVPRAAPPPRPLLANQQSAAGREGRSGGNSWERFFWKSSLSPSEGGWGGHRSPRLPSPAFPPGGVRRGAAGGCGRWGERDGREGWLTQTFPHCSLLLSPLPPPSPPPPS